MKRNKQKRNTPRINKAWAQPMEVSWRFIPGKQKHWMTDTRDRDLFKKLAH